MGHDNGIEKLIAEARQPAKSVPYLGLEGRPVGLAQRLADALAAEHTRADEAERTLRAVREYAVEALEPDEDSTVTVIRRGRGHTEESDWQDALREIRNMIDNAGPAGESAETRLRIAVERVLPALAKEFQHLAVERNFDGGPVEESWIVRTLRAALEGKDLPEPLSNAMPRL